MAIDVALLLPDTLNLSLTALNRTLRPAPDGFYFDSTHLPHLTLVQQVVNANDLKEITCAVDEALQHQAPLELVTTHVSRHHVSSTLGVGLTDPLAALHRHLMDRLESFSTGGDGREAFWADGDLPRVDDVEWVVSFRERSAFDRFDPHITIGSGRVTAQINPTPFVATQLALCHLGRFCTCRRVLRVWTLTAPER